MAEIFSQSVHDDGPKKYFHRGPNRLSRPCLNLANRNLNRSTLLIKHNRRHIKVKVKFALEQATKAQRGSTDGVGGQCQAPAALPPGKTRYALYWRLSGPQGRSGWARKVSLPPGFDPRTVQPVASGYIDWAAQDHTEAWSIGQTILKFGTRWQASG